MTGTELAETVHQDVETRIREGVKAVTEQILEEEMTSHIGAARREHSPLRRDERNGHYERDLITPVGRVEQLRVPRARQGEFLKKDIYAYQFCFAPYKNISALRWRCEPVLLIPANNTRF
ncbi:MAG: transposase [Blastocatellia bacterium]